MSDRDELIAKARKLSEAATPGPWIKGTHAPYAVFISVDGAPRHLISAPPFSAGTKADIELAAESSTLLPALADLAESEGRRADEVEAAASNLRRDNKALNDLVLAIERTLGISGYRAGESEEEICPRIAKLKGQVESMRPIVEAVRAYRQCAHDAFDECDHESPLYNLPLPPKEQP